MPAFDTTNEMTVIFDKYNTDKNSTFHNYPYYYHKHLDRYRKQDKLIFLEIGVCDSESLFAFREYFSNAKKVVGIDTDPISKKVEDISQSIHVEIGSQSDKVFLQNVHEKHGPFDIIIDDGSHKYHDILASFKTLFPLLNNGGIYIIEDTICIRQNMTYFYSLTKHLNYWRLDADEYSDHCVDPFKIDLQIYDPIAYSIGEITFSNSSIIITKDVKHHWITK